MSKTAEEQAAEKVALKEVKGQRDLYMLHHSLIVIEPEYNERIDFGDMESLKASMAKDGVKVPLRGKKRKNPKMVGGYEYVLNQGHRRHRGAKELESETGQKMLLPFMPDKRGYNEEDGLADQIIENNLQLPLNVMEQGNVFHKFINTFGYTEKQVAERVNYTVTYVRNCLDYRGLDKETRDYMVHKQVSPTEVTKILKQTGDPIRTAHIIKQTISVKEEKVAKQIKEEQTVTDHKGKDIAPVSKKAVEQAIADKGTPRKKTKHTKEGKNGVLYWYGSEDMENGVWSTSPDGIVLETSSSLTNSDKEENKTESSTPKDTEPNSGEGPDVTKEEIGEQKKMPPVTITHKDIVNEFPEVDSQVLLAKFLKKNKRESITNNIALYDVLIDIKNNKLAEKDLKLIFFK